MIYNINILFVIIRRTSQFVATTSIEIERKTSRTFGLHWSVFRSYRAPVEILEADQFCTCVFKVMYTNVCNRMKD